MLNESLVIYRCGGRVKLDEEARCRMCLRDKRIRGLTRHHLVPQWWFSERTRWQPGPQHADFARLGIGPFDVFRVRDCDANIVPLCWACHQQVEQDVSARRTLRKLLGANEVAFTVQTMGGATFDRLYPPTRRPSERACEAAAA